jgi:rhodanese-related sulfurtransferase
MFKTLKKEQFKEELDKWDSILIDVRTDNERRTFWKIQEKQLNMDIYNPKVIEQILALDKTKKYLIYCWHGNRSLSVMDFMKGNWFSRVCELGGWINAWNRK